jgi:hypothetical protein
METHMPSLREVQRAMRASLVERDDSAAAACILDDGLAPEQRLSIYRNTFASNLTSALRLSFPAVQRLVGAEFFEGAARMFALEQPPLSAYLDEYGNGFADFLARFPAAASLAYLPDVASLEWAVTRALHAPDREPLDLALLAAVGEADHDRVRFVPHPSVSLVRADYPVDIIWQAVLARDDAALADIDFTAGPVWLLVQRLAIGVNVTRVAEQSWRYAAELLAGRALGAALDSANGIDAPALLAEHIAAGRFVGFDLADALADHQPRYDAF